MVSRKRARRDAPAFVLDGSVALAWFFEDEKDAYAESVQDALAKSPAVVPGLWPLEIANALLVGERRKRATEAKVSRFLELLAALPIAADEQTAAKAWHETLGLARTHKLSSYDAAYLELALRQALPLATFDERLRAAMRTVGIPLYLTE